MNDYFFSQELGRWATYQEIKEYLDKQGEQP
jgi:hypothetical protein